jgi:phage tail sheath protein FI
VPQYLSPDVYIEEIDTGSKPIAGVGTSVGGMLGMAERGPVNIPIQLGSIADYKYWFGGHLDPETFVGQTCFLPHAVEGFFNNGGRELYVVRVLEESVATFAATQLFGVAATGAVPTELIAATATSPSTSLIYVLDDSQLTAGSPWVQVGDGSASDFAQRIAPAGTANDIVLRLPLVYGYDNALATTVSVDNFAVPAPVAGTYHLQSDVALGSSFVVLDNGAGIAADTLLRLGTAGLDEEYAFATAAAVQVTTTPASYQVTLAAPTQVFHPMGTGPNTLDVLSAPGAPLNHTNLASPGSTTAGGAMTPGATVIFVADRTGFAAGNLVRVSDGTHAEVRAFGSLSTVPLSTPAYQACAPGMTVQGVTLADYSAATPAGAANDKSLSVSAVAGSVVLVLDDRSGLAVGNLVRIGFATDPTREFIQIAALPNMPVSGPAPGQVLLAAPLAAARALPSQIHLQVTPAPGTGPVVAPALPAARGATSLVVTDATGLATGTIVRITADGVNFDYKMLSGPPALAAPAPISLNASLANPHLAGDPVVIRAPLLQVNALDQGAWGNRLRVAVEAGPPLVQSTIASFQDATHLRLLSGNGVEAGTVLAVTDPVGTITNLKVIAIDRQSNFLITLDASTPLPVSVTVGNAVTSLEFQIDVFLLRQPDPAVPSRNNTLLDFEVFTQLSMDPRHSRHIDKVIGTTWVPGLSPPVDDEGTPLRKSDMRPEGASWYIRIHDEETVAANKLAIRPGPVALTDTLATGGVQAARMPLVGGDDGIAAVTASTYVGSDDVEPELRSGIHCFRNQEDISILCVPGRTEATVQGALITLTENLQYRFAVLDGPQPPDDQITDAQLQRQQFDTKYAAIYHPWLVIPDPFPTNLAAIANYPIPPSGHVMGVYARVDAQRGVHKAPANEFVNGITGLQRKLNKSEQDVLNPYPVNINVIRDFTSDNRGLRVYGARVMTSDPDWKYVNVRRLLNFIEQSLNQGLQWVVFEPNDSALWARVRRTITLFLTQVWRSGALQGTKPDQGFFVNCGPDTMTETDQQNGLLIAVIGVAPVYPAEFVVVRIGLWTGSANT